ncbi:MAG TPA: hypothetical protein VNS09_19000 [Solirubrobacter sp.]|nr:hypothetical protein [Solirubrobacter sp.]
MRRYAPLVLLAAIGVIVAMGPWALPLLVVVSLLLTGRYVGEERILAARAARTRTPRAVKVRWSRRHAAALVSLLERTPRSPRGPPALAA